MKFRVREGWQLFSTVDQMIEHQSRPESGVRPLAVAGNVHEFRLERLQQIVRGGHLGCLEPMDAEAKQYFGATTPRISKTLTHPALFARPKETHS